MESNPVIYESIEEHQKSESWVWQEFITYLHEWADIFCTEFNLNIADYVLCIQKLNSRCYGHFRKSHNGFGLQSEIAFNSTGFEERTRGAILGTLLHELLHKWQAEHGQPSSNNYHNREFQKKALELGMVINEKGVLSQYVPNGEFLALLETHGVSLPEDPSPASIPSKLKGTSKLKKWFCGCTNVRVATKLHAHCLSCKKTFIQVV